MTDNTSLVSSVLQRDPKDLHTIIRRGLGRAVFFVRENYVAERDRPIITQSLLHRNVFDNQLEIARGEYLCEVILATDDKAFYIDFLQQVLADTSIDCCRRQILDVVHWLIHSDVTELRTPLYGAIANDIAQGNLEYMYDLLELDGMDAFRFIAEKLAPDEAALHELLLRPYPDDDYANVWPYLLASDLKSFYDGDEEKTNAALAQLAAEEGRVGILAKFVQQDLAQPERPFESPPVPSYEEIKSFIQTDPPEQHRSYRIWGKKLPEEVLIRLANDLTGEDAPQRQVSYLVLFQARPFPGDLYHLIELTRHIDEVVAYRAMQALSNNQHPEIRRHALTLIAEGNPSWGLSLLEKNAGAGDEEWLNTMSFSDDDEFIAHNLGSGLLDYAEAHPTAQLAPAMIQFYEDGPCSMCRHRAVEWLLEHDCLPDWIRAECQYDSYDETWRLVFPSAQGTE